MSLPRFLPVFRRASARSLLAVIAVGTFAACGSDDADEARDDEASTTTEVERDEAGEGSDDTPAADDSPDEPTVPMSEVLTTLPKVRDLGNEAAVAAGQGDWPTALAKHAELQKMWESVEATVADADRDAHEAIDAAHDLIEEGAKTEALDRVTQGAEAQRITIDAFIDANS